MTTTSKTLIGLLGAFLLAIAFHRPAVQGTPKFPPLTITYSITRIDPASLGGKVDTYTRIEATRSDGNQAFATPDQHGIVRTSFDDQGINVLWDLQNKNIKTTMGDGVPWQPYQDNFGSECEGISGTRLEERTILGFRTIGIEVDDHMTTPPIPPATTPHVINQARKIWVAPDLACRELLSVLTISHDGMDGGSTTEAATSVVLGDPDPQWFTVPDSAVEMGKTEFYQALGLKFSPNGEAKKTIEQMNKMYLQQKAKRESLQARARLLWRKIQTL